MGSLQEGKKKLSTQEGWPKAKKILIKQKKLRGPPTHEYWNGVFDTILN